MNNWKWILEAVPAILDFLFQIYLITWLINVGWSWTQP